MWKYNHVETDYLQHRLVDGRRVKYVAKVPLGGDKFRYFYTMPEYQSYLNSKKKTLPTVKNTPSAINKDSTSNVTVKKTGSTVKKEYDLSYVGPTKPGERKQYTQGPKSTVTVTKSSNQQSKDSQIAISKAKGGSGGKFGDDYDPKAPIDNSKLTSLEDLPKQNLKLSVDENQNRVNPDFDRRKPDYSLNCAYCTATMDLRRRGYDVEARPYANNYSPGTVEIATWYKNTSNSDWVNCNELLVGKYLIGAFGGKKITNDESAEALSKSMLKHGDGSYGNFAVMWNNGGGHSMEWSVKNGEVYIRDTQANQTLTFTDWYNTYKDYLLPIPTYSMMYLRTDNRELSDKILEICRPRRGLNGST